MTYLEMLADPRWQKKRLEVLQFRGFKCEQCEDEKSQLHVHHRYYVAGRFPWRYPDFCYQVLCCDCHAAKRSPEADESEFMEWESALNFFGDNLFSLWADIHEIGLVDARLYDKEISHRERQKIIQSVADGVAATRDAKQ